MRWSGWPESASGCWHVAGAQLVVQSYCPLAAMAVMSTLVAVLGEVVSATAEEIENNLAYWPAWALPTMEVVVAAMLVHVQNPILFGRSAAHRPPPCRLVGVGSGGWILFVPLDMGHQQDRVLVVLLEAVSFASWLCLLARKYPTVRYR